MLNPSERLQRIRYLLQQALAPTKLEIMDESAKHHGHAGAASGAGHFAIEIESHLFQQKNLIDCQRLVYAALHELIPSEIHALRIKTRVAT